MALKSSLILLDVDVSRLGGGSGLLCCRLWPLGGILVLMGFIFLVLFARPKCFSNCIFCPIFINICMFFWGCGLVGLVLGVGLLLCMLVCLVGCSLGIFCGVGIPGLLFLFVADSVVDFSCFGRVGRADWLSLAERCRLGGRALLGGLGGSAFLVLLGRVGEVGGRVGWVSKGMLLVGPVAWLSLVGRGGRAGYSGLAGSVCLGLIGRVGEVGGRVWQLVVALLWLPVAGWYIPVVVIVNFCSMNDEIGAISYLATAASIAADCLANSTLPSGF